MPNLDDAATSALRQKLAHFMAAFLAEAASRLGSTDISQDVSSIEYSERLGRYQGIRVSKLLPERGLGINLADWFEASREWEEFVELVLDTSAVRGSLLDFVGDTPVEEGYERGTLFHDFLGPFVVGYLTHQGSLDWNEAAFDRAFAELLRFIARATVTTVVEIPIGGFRSDLQVIEMGEGVRIEQFTDERKRRLWEREFAHGSLGWMSSFTLMDISDWTHFLVVEWEEPKAHLRGGTAPDGWEHAVLDARNRRDLAFVALHLLQPGGVWAQSEFTHAVQPAFDRRRDSVMMKRGRGHGDSYRLRAGQGDQLRDTFRWLRSDEHRRLEPALRRFEGLYDRTDAEDRLIDCWIALENLFLSDGGAQELSYRVSLRAASYVGATRRERSELFQALRESYGERSKLVHGRHPANVRTAADTTEDIVRRAINRAIREPTSLDVRQLDASLFD